MQNTDLPALSDAAISQFITDGYVRIDDGFDAQLAAQARAILWAAMGLSPDDPLGWTRPVIRLGMFTEPPFVMAANTSILHRAYDQLAGAGRWIAPKAMGTFPVRFPSQDDPGDAGWHVDMSFGFDNPDFMQWRANILSRDRALLMLFLFSDTGADDAPTRIRVGSHQHIARQLLPHGDAGLTLGQLAANGFAESENCDEVLAKGKAGTVYLCQPFIMHSAQPHGGNAPRFLAQPPLLPSGPFDPALPPSPVQIAIRQACGLSL